MKIPGGGGGSRRGRGREGVCGELGNLGGGGAKYFFGGPETSTKQRRIGPFSRDSREFRNFRDSRDSSSETTSFVMTPFSSPDFRESISGGVLNVNPAIPKRIEGVSQAKTFQNKIFRNKNSGVSGRRVYLL